VEDGGVDVESYVAQLDSGQGYIQVYEGPVCECSCANLLPGFTYKARVAAKSVVGVGQWSESVEVTTRPVVPGQCCKPWLLGKAKAHVLHLKWGKCVGLNRVVVSVNGIIYLCKLLYHSNKPL